MVLNLKTTEIYKIVMYNDGLSPEKRIIIFTTAEEYTKVEESIFLDRLKWGSKADWKIIYHGKAYKDRTWKKGEEIKHAKSDQN